MKKIKKLTDIPRKIAGRYYRYRAGLSYRKWLEDSPGQSDGKQLTKEPLISLVVPVYNTPRKIFAEMIDSVSNQTYQNWELVLVDDASPDLSIREFTGKRANEDDRIKHIFLDKNQGISGATNEGIKSSKGEYIALLDHDDILRPEALYEVACSINDGDYEFIYTDEDKIPNNADKRFWPFLKPDYNQDLIWSVNYITHFTVIKKSLLDRAGYENSKYDGAQDWELFLRCLRHIKPEKVHHIPKILYSWRVHQSSTAKDLSIKPDALDAQKAAIKDELEVRGFGNFSIIPNGAHMGLWGLKLGMKDNPKIDICILGTKKAQYQIQAIKNHTSYKNYEIHTIAPDDVSAVLELSGEYVIFVTDELAIQSEGWVQDLIGDAQRDDLAFVQAALKSEENLISNLRSILGEESLGLFLNMDKTSTSWIVYRESRYNIDSVHGGVLAISTKKLRPALQNNQSIDFYKISCQLAKKGYRSLYNPYVKVLK